MPLAKSIRKKLHLGPILLAGPFLIGLTVGFLVWHLPQSPRCIVWDQNKPPTSKPPRHRANLAIPVPQKPLALNKPKQATNVARDGQSAHDNPSSSFNRFSKISYTRSNDTEMGTLTVRSQLQASDDEAA